MRFRFSRLRSASPDVIVLQEVLSPDLLERFAHELGMQAFFGSGNSRKRVALLSALPVQSFNSLYSFPSIYRNVIQARIVCEFDKTIQLIGIHAPPNLSIGFEMWRWWEARNVLQLLKPNTTELCLVLGDFNAIAPGDRPIVETMPKQLKFLIYLQGKRFYHFAIKQYLSHGLIDCFRALLPKEDGFTLPTASPNARLDYILASANLRPLLKECRVVLEPDVTRKASDHYALITEFRS